MPLSTQISSAFQRVATEIKTIRTEINSAKPSYGNIPAGSTITVTKSGGVWPGSPTSRSDVIIIWKGADPSPAIVASRTVGTAGMLDNVDIRLVA